VACPANLIGPRIWQSLRVSSGEAPAHVPDFCARVHGDFLGTVVNVAAKDAKAWQIQSLRS